MEKELKDDNLNQIEEIEKTGATLCDGSLGRIHCMSIIGQIEGPKRICKASELDSRLCSWL